MTGNELAIGGFTVAMLLSYLLKMIFNTWTVPNKYKAWIAVLLGIALSLVGCYSTETMFTIPIVASYMAQGFMTGAASVGIYEATKTHTNGDDGK